MEQNKNVSGKETEGNGSVIGQVDVNELIAEIRW